MEKKTRMSKRALRIKPWVAAALVLGLALLGYYGVLGVRFLNYRSHEQTQTAETTMLSRSLRRATAKDVEPLRVQLAAAQQEQEQASALYARDEPEQMVRLVVDLARDAGVELGHISVGTPAKGMVSNVSYSVQPLEFLVSGDLTHVISFFSKLHQRAPNANIVKVGFSGLQEKPVANVQISLYESPEFVVQKDAKDAKTGNAQSGGGQRPAAGR